MYKPLIGFSFKSTLVVAELDKALSSHQKVLTISIWQFCNFVIVNVFVNSSAVQTIQFSSIEKRLCNAQAL